MKILAIDTATEACSAALWLEGEVSRRFELAPRRHTELLLPMVDELMAEAGLVVAQLDAISFGRGPGSFTGVRIATAAAQGLAWAADLPVVPVSTLEAIAQATIDEQNAEAVATAIDARMSEIYWATWLRADEGRAVLQGEEQVIPPHQIPELTGEHKWHACGSGWDVYGEVLQPQTGIAPGKIDRERLPDAAVIARIAADAFQKGETVSPADALPVYLRNKVTHQRTPKKPTV